MTRRQRILAVDDSPVNLAILEDMLADSYTLRCAESGESGLAIATEFQPDLVLLDIMMPGLDGYATCQRLRQDKQLRGAKIILLSAKTEVQDRLQGYEAGADDFVSKPFNHDELLAKIAVFLRLKSVEELDELKAGILKLLSHETRTPLNGILGVLQLLADSAACAADDEQELIHLAQGSAELLERLIQKGMLYSELRSGTATFAVEPVSVQALIAEVAAELRPQAASKGIPIELRVSPAAVVLADPGLLRFVCASLLDNAIRFSPTAAPIRIEAAPQGAQVQLSVADCGPGIAAAYRPHLFAGFISPDIMHHTQGQGLSLAIAKEIIERHGGAIVLDSAPGQGACFRVQLPSAQPAPASQAAAPIPEPAVG